MQDKIITCLQCDKNFVFSAEERRRFEERGFDEPTRCPECRKKKNKGPRHEGEAPWKDKGRKKHSKRKNRGDYDNE